MHTCGLQTHTLCQSDSFASADSHQEIPAAVFLPFPPTHMRLISHSTLYLSHLSAFVLVSFIIAAVNTSAIGGAQCEVADLKEFHSNVRCAYLKNLTYCLVEWQIKWKWHRVLISCLFSRCLVTFDNPVSSEISRCWMCVKKNPQKVFILSAGSTIWIQKIHVSLLVLPERFSAKYSSCIWPYLLKDYTNIFTK